MPPRKNSNIESITEEYIDGAVKVHVKASEVPPRQNLNISFKDADMLGDEVTLSNQEAYEESHGKIYEMTHNNTVPWRNWAFYMILVSMLTVCFTFAKYASFASSDAETAAVASFNVSVTGSASSDAIVTASVNNSTGSTPGDINIIFTKDSPKGTTRTITFTVENKSDVVAKITDVHFLDGLVGDVTYGDPVHEYWFTVGDTPSATNNGKTSLSASDFSNMSMTNGEAKFTLTFKKNDASLSEGHMNASGYEDETNKYIQLVITVDQVD